MDYFFPLFQQLSKEAQVCNATGAEEAVRWNGDVNPVRETSGSLYCYKNYYSNNFPKMRHGEPYKHPNKLKPLIRWVPGQQYTCTLQIDNITKLESKGKKYIFLALLVGILLQFCPWQGKRQRDALLGFSHSWLASFSDTVCMLQAASFFEEKRWHRVFQ